MIQELRLNFKKIQGIKFFSTTNYLRVDKDKITEEVNPNAGSDEEEEVNPGSDEEEIEEVNPGSDDESGYGTNSDRSRLDNDGAAMFDVPAQDLPDDILKQFKKEIRDLYRNHLRSDEQELRQTFKDRDNELKTEIERRKANGTMSDDGSSVDTDPSIPAASPAASLELQSSPKVDHNDQEKDKSSGNSLPSSSNKRKFEEDSESSAQPTKQFKQDSSDITNATELFDFGGGDD